MFSHDQILINPKSNGLVHDVWVKNICVCCTVFADALGKSALRRVQTSNDTCVCVESKLCRAQDRALLLFGAHG